MIEAGVYKALGDPIRLEIVRRLSTRSTSTIGELSTDLGLSRQGARKQLQVLVKANVVHLKQRGRQTDVTLDKNTLHNLHELLLRTWNANGTPISMH